MATSSSILACRTPWREEPGGLPSMWLQSQTHLSDCPFKAKLSCVPSSPMLIIIFLLCKTKSVPRALPGGQRQRLSASPGGHTQSLIGSWMPRAVQHGQKIKSPYVY